MTKLLEIKQKEVFNCKVKEKTETVDFTIQAGEKDADGNQGVMLSYDDLMVFGKTDSFRIIKTDDEKEIGEKNSFDNRRIARNISAIIRMPENEKTLKENGTYGTLNKIILTLMELYNISPIDRSSKYCSYLQNKDGKTIAEFICTGKGGFKIVENPDKEIFKSCRKEMKLVDCFNNLIQPITVREELGDCEKEANAALKHMMRINH